MIKDQKMTNKQRKRYITYWNSLRNKSPWNKGVPCTEETKEKISKKFKGKKHNKKL